MINTRKKEQYYKPFKRTIVEDSIAVVYKSKGKKDTEFLDVTTIEEAKEIYKRFNNTLRPHENKRVPLRFYKVKKGYVKLEEIKEE